MIPCHQPAAVAPAYKSGADRRGPVRAYLLAGAELLGRHPGVNQLFHPQRTSEQRTLL